METQKNATLCLAGVPRLGLPWARHGHDGQKVLCHRWKRRRPCSSRFRGVSTVPFSSTIKHEVFHFSRCSTDTFLLTELTYDIDLMKAHAQSQVFKYADSNQLYFTCQIRLCQKQMGLCQGVTVGDFAVEHSLPNASFLAAQMQRQLSWLQQRLFRGTVHEGQLDSETSQPTLSHHH
jgi:hypothetical protein